MRRAVLLAIVVLGVCANVGQADSFSFSIGGGHGHHGHHHGHHHHRHCYGPHWGFSVWSPPPPRYVYVAPPIVQERIYVQPPVVQQPVIIQQQPLSSTIVPSNVAANSLPAPPTRTASTGSPVVIRNTNGKGAPVAFLLDDASQELRDGQARSYSGSSHVIEFDRGGDLGTARYELASGVYAFSVTDRGWELVRDSNSARTADRPALKRNELPGDPVSR